MFNCTRMHRHCTLSKFLLKITWYFGLIISVGGLMLWYLTGTISLALAAVIIYIYYLRKGQFDDSEDVKYQMFRDEE